MSLTDQVMTVRRWIWHTVPNTIEVVLRSNEVPPPPEWFPPDQWWGGAGVELAFTIPSQFLKQASTTPTTVWGRTGTDPDGTPQYTRYTWDQTKKAWVNPIRVDSGNVPI